LGIKPLSLLDPNGDPELPPSASVELRSAIDESNPKVSWIHDGPR
jgi:hypothetical protein